MNNPTHGEFCFTMIGRADIEGSKSHVAMNAWPPQVMGLFGLVHAKMKILSLITPPPIKAQTRIKEISKMIHVTSGVQP